MRDYAAELENRVKFIRELLDQSGARGIVFGNSGGKDSALVGILCKKACEDTVGLIMPCQSSMNFGQDMEDGNAVAKKFGIETRIIDLSAVKTVFVSTMDEAVDLNHMALTNINPRLRMITLYAVAASENRLVAGTGNRSERHVGYFTKWGDGAYDFNPISDLTVTEVYEFLNYLEAPKNVMRKAPSGGLFDGQTDEADLGITYARVDNYLLNGIAADQDKRLIDGLNHKTEHKRKMPAVYEEV